MLHLITSDLDHHQTEALIIPICEDADIHDQAISPLIQQAKAFKEFKGEKDDELMLCRMADTVAERILFLGLGKLEKITAESFRAVAGKAVSQCIKKHLTEIVIAVPASKKLPSDTLQALMEGAVLGNHLFDRYKNEKKLKPLEHIHFWVKPEVAKKNQQVLSKIETICEGTLMAREWVSTPSNDKTPERFAEAIAAEAGKYPLKITVLDEAKLRAEKFGAILAVASGSDSHPCMVILEYAPIGAKKTVALVGKGVTFDAGGINLKTSEGLQEMKSDMSGAAAVAATMITAARLNLKTRLIGVIPIVENMPSGKATRPGDVITTYSGKTVEIGNTDAEGRLILADAVSYAIKTYKPQTLIDLATLTGACVVALGEKIAGVFSFDQKLAQLIIDAGTKTHERCWRMPLPEDYKELFKSDIADINNMSAKRWGGAIIGALFISEFVNDTCWAHIDIAGPSFITKQTDYCGVGGTGFGVRLLCELLEKLNN